MKSDPRQNWCFDSSSRYSGLPRCLPSSSRRLPRSPRRELLLFVLSRPSSSSRLPRSGRRPSVRAYICSKGFFAGLIFGGVYFRMGLFILEGLLRLKMGCS